MRYLPGPQQRKVVLNKNMIGLGLVGEEVIERVRIVFIGIVQ